MQLRITMNEMMKAAPAALKAIPNMQEVALARMELEALELRTVSN
jgi:hypothetical protein